MLPRPAEVGRGRTGSEALPGLLSALLEEDLHRNDVFA